MIQKRYEGFLDTHFLWSGNAIYGIEQFQINSKKSRIQLNIKNKIRLGKYIEEFVFYELKHHKNISLLAQNIQIQENKITLGELDCLLIKDSLPIHLEIVYKFYLYDESVGDNEIEHFIGPNRKDSLVEKLNKLKESQLPILHTTACRTYLKDLDLVNEKIAQRVYFKAQLFIPFNQKVHLKILNKNCIQGFYVRRKDLQDFENCKFNIPKKLDWLINPHPNVEWMNFKNFYTLAQNYLTEKYAPLFWLKNNNGVIEKMFLVWW